MAQLPDVTPLLLNAQDPNADVRNQAEHQLRTFQEQNYPAFLASLAGELANVQKPALSRQLAGLVLKNSLDAKDDARRNDLHQRWNALDPNLKSNVREALLATLKTDSHDVRHTAALVTAKVAAIELPRKEWPTLIKSLEDNMNAQPPDHGVRQATLEALGYVCEEMAQRRDEVLTPLEVNMILTAVVSGMRPEEPSVETRLAATTALSNAVEFAEHNFENKKERDYIMQVVCQGTIAPDPRIRQLSFQCLHEIAANYYPKLYEYMQEIFKITVNAIQQDQEEVALQAIEFWNTICDYEIELEEEGESGEVNHHFIAAVCPHLLPVILEQLVKQEEGQEQDESMWNISMASGTCLGLMAKVAGDVVVPHVMPFVQANINKSTSPEDWRLREAATFAFGSILEGPSPSVLLEIVKQALMFFLPAMKDPHPYVRDTTAWTIKRIFEFLSNNNVLSGTPQALVTQENLGAIVSVLVEGLKDEPHVVYRVCDAIAKLAQGFKDQADTTSPLSPFFKDTVGALLQAADRYSATENSNVQLAAFEAINSMVQAATQDTVDTVAQLIPMFLAEIKKTMDMPVTSGRERERQAELQSHLCGVLHWVIDKLSESDATRPAVLRFGDDIMATLLKIFSNRSATVHEEAMLTVGAFTYACQHNFAKYLPEFYPYLRMGLANHQEWHVCLSTVGVLGDVCTNVEDAVWPFCDEIMRLLIDNLGSDDVHRNIKPHIFSAFGDIALVIGDRFERYLEPVKRMLQQAMQLSVVQAANPDDDFIDYNNELRQGILDAYSGIFQGMTPPKNDQLLRSEVPMLLEFVTSIGASESQYEDGVVKSAVNLLGDVCAVIPNVAPLFQQARNQPWQSLVQYCMDSETLNESTEWAVGQINKVLSTGSSSS